MPQPYGLLAEVTHQCPLHCIYCSNPLTLLDREDELATEDWLRVIREAAGLGVVQVHFSGGEPLVRGDLETLVAECRGLGLYTNLITSGLGLTESRAKSLVSAGLNSAQLSIQGDAAESTNLVAASRRFDKKEAAARIIRDAGLPLNMNVVLHRLNLSRLDAIIDVCESWGAERLELANSQYYGWALRNRDLLMPSKAQLDEAVAVYERRKAELGDHMEILWILPDYYEPYPKPCMGGWAQNALTVAPDGTVYPCPVAAEVTTMNFSSVRDHDLAWIWSNSEAFQAFRGTEWMPDPCHSCPRKEIDFGGCRCQAFALTGDAARTDPVCMHSPDHHLVQEALVRANEEEVAADGELLREKLVYRRPRASARRL
ncbi:pyrroloquinoline quinone biosynthesis protein PqqE [Amycolatopsis sp. FDAARGOS 1241]|uniref:pyrroloquinoline quinone biosynthesis protein PqqE n=1 Tax=Amycolatopsis sp. FDAARGOS 1241 TaxID=2778070 RepID=UPI001952796F|nr:pyrroloquinoline quinone biosynthesis protein PqqE [Amycolatopsis sp. FDAARGOS 1241]QRP51271.1 pyrroloquinoline quinone biosynthesis protein PqqE [Amycolatopsis sp. FDAARGOS 1241]